MALPMENFGARCRRRWSAPAFPLEESPWGMCIVEERRREAVCRGGLGQPARVSGKHPRFGMRRLE